MKKSLVALLLLLVLSCVGLAACGTNGNGSSEPDVPPAPVEKVVEISATSKTLKLFEGYSLNVTADGEIVTAEWSSSNEQVATVVNGIVTAKRLGTATITAEFEQKTYSCAIEVVEPDIVPALVMDQTALVYVGTDKLINVTCLYNGEPSEITDFAFTIENKTVAEAVAGEGGFTVKGLAVGETKIIVSANWYGVSLLGEMTVTVADQVSLSLSASTVTVYKYSDGEHSATARISVTEVLSNGTVIENPVITWTSDDDKIATVSEDGTITAAGIGSTLINVVYTEGEKQYVAYCQVTVAYNVKAVSSVFNLYANRACVIDLSKAYGDDLGDVTVTDKLASGEIEHVRDGNVYTLTANGLTVGNERTLVLSYESGLQLEIPVNVYDLLITTKAELLQFRSDIENYKNVILGAEIDLESDGFGRIASTQAEGETQTEANANAKTFTGTFEGNGYAIKNGNYGGVGLFQNIGETAVVKNVNFQGAILHSWSADSAYRTSTVFANDIFGTVKNVFIDCSVIRHLNANYVAGQYGTAFARGITSSANVSNVIVYWKTKYFLNTTGGQSQWDAKRTACTSFVAQEGVGAISKDATVSNLYSFNKTYGDGQDAAVPGTVENASAVKSFDYDTTCAAAELSTKGFDSLWVFSGIRASMKNYDQLNAETFKIYTASDLLTFRANITSYNRVELMNDIDLGTSGFGKIADTLEVGETQTEPNVKAKTFMGFFEGNGYSIKNGNYGGVGLFQNIGAGAVVQNVAFEGSTLHSWTCSSEDDYRCSSIVANHVYGTVKNVLIDCVVEKHNNANGAGGNYGTAFATTVQAGANVSNVIVYFRTGRVVRADAHVYHTDKYSSGCTTFVGNAGVGSISSAATVSNLYSFNKTYDNGQDKALNPSSEGADKVIVKDYTDTCADAELSTKGFDSIWDFSRKKATLKNPDYKTITIDSVEDLILFRNNIDTYDYAELTCDVDLGTSGFGKIADSEADAASQGEANDSAKTFNGVFEGNGYKIKNGNYGGVGLFKNIGANAIVRNVAFDGATLHSWTHDSTYNTTSIFANDVYGTVENVLIDCSVIRHLNASSAAGNFGAAFARNVKSGASVSGVIIYWKSNCVVNSAGDYWFKYDAEVTAARSFVSHKGSVASGATLTNVYSFNKTYGTAQDGTGSDLVTLNDYSTTCAAAELSTKGFDSIWDFSGDRAILTVKNDSNSESAE